ncbi:uncharacterized protein LOC105189159 [Harpegnathos saltator]|uniref:uncharacterized protein LOC105189159 n=1 Tax=Harpegnathos saltator TaxID=610380 RepID=UPI000DBECF50|nr:uncharacterized protein LOC105189159 [Harpegnathos saltator]
MAQFYNQFFNPNICHVCKKVDKGNFLSCDWCGLISYCSKEHKTHHHIEHSLTCAVTTQFLEIRPQKDTRRFNDWQQWIHSRKELLKLVQNNIGYTLDPYEKQAILWSKSCCVCHQQAELKTCERCFSVNYCNGHKKAFRARHWGSNCDDSVLLLNINIEAISGRTSNMSYGFLQSINEGSKFEAMLELCLEFVISQRKNHTDWLAKDYVRSDYLSDPLSIYSGFKRIDFLEIIKEPLVIIHIIGASSVDKNGLPAWEILLHLVPEIQRLVIVLINPKLEDSFIRQDLCNHCNEKKKYLCFVLCPMLYHDFISSDWVYKEPTLIVGFNVTFDKERTWNESLKAMQNRNCPLVLGYSRILKCDKNIYKIVEILKGDIFPFGFRQNYFKGLAPHRDLETGDIRYRNEELVIYKDLNVHHFIS